VKRDVDMPLHRRVQHREKLSAWLHLPCVQVTGSQVEMTAPPESCMHGTLQHSPLSRLVWAVVNGVDGRDMERL